MILESKRIVDFVNSDTTDVLSKCSFYGSKPYIVGFSFQHDNFYTKLVAKAAKELGIDYKERFMGVSTSPEDMSRWTKTYAMDLRCIGMFIARPCMRWVLDWAYYNFPSRKDIDCVSLQNLLWDEYESVRVPTVKAVELLLGSNQLLLEDKSYVVIGRSREIGRPMAQMLLKRDANVTVLHSRTRYLKPYLENAFGVIACTGADDIIRRGDVANLAIAVDLQHDFSDDALNEVECHTPRVGGVGPLSIACMLNNAAYSANFKFGFNHVFRGVGDE